VTKLALDFNAIDRLLFAIGGDAEDLKELAVDFCESTPTLLQDLNDALVSQDLTKMRIASHTLKANAREFGATDLENCCRELEAQCLQGELVDGSGQLIVIDNCLTATIDAIENLGVFDA